MPTHADLFYAGWWWVMMWFVRLHANDQAYQLKLAADAQVRIPVPVAPASKQAKLERQRQKNLMVITLCHMHVDATFCLKIEQDQMALVTCKQMDAERLAFIHECRHHIGAASSPAASAAAQPSSSHAAPADESSSHAAPADEPSSHAALGDPPASSHAKSKDDKKTKKGKHGKKDNKNKTGKHDKKGNEDKKGKHGKKDKKTTGKRCNNEKDANTQSGKESKAMRALASSDASSGGEAVYNL